MGDRLLSYPSLTPTGVESLYTDSTGNGVEQLTINALMAWLASNGLVAKTVTVNGNALSGNISITASQITSGTLPHAQLPALVPSDLPIAAYSQKSVASPTAPNSTAAYTMQGLAGSITPTRTGRVLIIISGTIVETTGTAAGVGVEYALSVGTGAAPGSNTTQAGTVIGTIQEFTNPSTVTAADVHIPFSSQALATGLTLNTAYWIDLAAQAITTASYVGFSNVSISAFEQ